MGTAEMLTEINKYLCEVRENLHLDPFTEKKIIGELYTYFQEKINELQLQGYTEKEAAKDAIRSCGRARVIARLMYEAHSKGSWIEAVLSSQPHLIVAVLFGTHLWSNPIFVTISFILIVGITLLGWWHGKPNWLYSWTGYALLPLLLSGFICRHIVANRVHLLISGDSLWGSGGMLVLLVLFYAFSIWLVLSTTIRVIRRDWILASLMLVPLPILGIWISNIERFFILVESVSESIYRWDLVMATIFCVLSLACILFIRLRQRALKVGAIILGGIIGGLIIMRYMTVNISFFGLLFVSFLLMLFLVSPALLEFRINHRSTQKELSQRPSTTK